MHAACRGGGGFYIRGIGVTCEPVMPMAEPKNDSDTVCAEKADADGKPAGAALPIRSVRQKIGEGRDNLRRRAEWFGRRNGK
jgi:hypothetical protein